MADSIEQKLARHELLGIDASVWSRQRSQKPGPLRITRVSEHRIDIRERPGTQQKPLGVDALGQDPMFQSPTLLSLQN
jgi:hypothetical protein